MAIRVETIIRAPQGELWRRTQDPGEHVRWDLRFSAIDYLPKESPEAPQRFLYRTRIGLGLEIRGEGESTGERDLRTGARVSALRFGSDEPLSLIASGSGYWKYEPLPGAEGEAVRFTTVYDYTPRWGLLGRLADLAFRPAIAWATAWSFDRLRLWLERGERPESAGRRALVHAVARAGLAFVWLWHGLVPKLLAADPLERTLTSDGGIPAEWVEPVVLAAGGMEIAFGLALLLWHRSRLLPALAIAALLVLLASAGTSTPAVLTTAFNPVSLTVATVALAAVDLLSLRDLPSAAATRWSSRHRP